MKKLLAIFVSLIVLIGLMGTAAMAVEPPETDTTWYNAAENSFTLSDAADLAGLAQLVNDGNNFAGKTIVLGADIDLVGIQWQPIGGDSVYFAGEFDGNGKTISNLTNTEDVARKGLFGLVEKCYIHDLTLKDVKFSGNTTDARIGALAGNLQYYNVIENVTIDGLDYDLSDTDGLIGGLAGYSWTSYVKNCVVKNADMNISSTSGSCVGVMIAYGRGVDDARTNFPYADKIAEVDYQGESLWNYCDSKVEGATVNLNGTVSFGGFLGADTYNHWRNYAHNNTVTGLAVTCAAGDGVYTVGGFMGGQYGGYDAAALSNNTVTGTITSSGTNTASTFGGFYGYKGGRPGGATDCTADVNITVAAGDVGGFCGETQQYFAHEYKFNGCKAEGDVSTSSGTAGGFIANVQHGGDGTSLNVTVTDCAVSGTVKGATANALVGNIDDNKNGTATGGTVKIAGNEVAENVTVNNAAVTAENMYGGNTELIPAAYIGEQGYETLNEALDAVQPGVETTITLSAGTHMFPTWTKYGESLGGKIIVFKANKDATLDATFFNVNGTQNLSGSDLTFDGVNVNFPADSWYQNGYTGLNMAGGELTFKNSTISGAQYLYVPTATFTDCVFNNSADSYSVITYAANNVTFTNCTFNTAGKAVLLYNDYAVTTAVTVTNCTFNSDSSVADDKAAVETGYNTALPCGDYEFTVTIYDCSATGFVANNSTSNLWGNKDDMDGDGLTVYVDTVQVYPAAAYIDETGYASLQDAIAAVQNGETIVLKRATSTDTITVSKDIEFIIKDEGDYLKADIQPGQYTTMNKVDNGDDTTTYTFDYSRPVISGGSSTYSVTVAAAANGTVSAAPKSASENSTITVTVTPDDGYELDAVSVKDKNGKEIALTKVSDNKYTFVMPASRVTVTASFKEIEKETVSIAFIDVLAGEYYYDAVLWAVENGVTDGTSTTTFSPLMSCTRAQAVTFLWRAAGSPEPTGTVNPFADVDADEYYYKAVLWAVENGITDGTSATTFSPDETVTRAQVVTFLYRLAGEPAVSGSNAFGDVAADAYYADAVQSAVVNGITDGTSDSTFSPELNCNRAQIVTFLYRYFVK